MLTFTRTLTIKPSKVLLDFWHHVNNMEGKVQIILMARVGCTYRYFVGVRECNHWPVACGIEFHSPRCPKVPFRLLPHGLHNLSQLRTSLAQFQGNKRKLRTTLTSVIRLPRANLSTFHTILRAFVTIFTKHKKNVFGGVAIGIDEHN